MQTFKYLAVLVLGFLAVVLWLAAPLIVAVVLEQQFAVRMTFDQFGDFVIVWWMFQIMFTCFAYAAINEYILEPRRMKARIASAMSQQD